MSLRLASQESSVMKSSLIVPARSGLLQRKCGCGQRTIAGAECKSCKNEEENGELQRAAINTESINEVPPVVHDALRSSGQPLDAQTRSFMEPRFSHDFSGVRVHTDARAAESARAVNALAFTVGQDIVFGAHQYAPSSAQGRRLLAHELTHTIQQSGTARSMMPSLRVGPADDAHEREADAQAARVVETGEVATAQAHAFSAASGLQRQPAKGGTGTKTPKSTPAQTGPCMKVAKARTFSRGNDDGLECQYETALVKVNLMYDPCSCSATKTTVPLRLEYQALMGGKSFGDRAGTIPETQASTIASGIDPAGRTVGPGVNLEETGGAVSGPLVHTEAGAAGDPGDTLAQSLDLQAALPCAGGSASGTVDLGLNIPSGGTITRYTSETVTWSIKTKGKKVETASLKISEATPGGRIATTTVDVTAGGKRYPNFPGKPRDKGCACHPVTGEQFGKSCKPKGSAGVGPTGGSGKP